MPAIKGVVLPPRYYYPMREEYLKAPKGNSYFRVLNVARSHSPLKALCFSDVFAAFEYYGVPIYFSGRLDKPMAFL